MYWDVDLVSDDWCFVRSISFHDNLVNHCVSDWSQLQFLRDLIQLMWFNCQMPRYVELFIPLWLTLWPPAQNNKRAKNIFNSIPKYNQFEFS